MGVYNFNVYVHKVIRVPCCNENAGVTNTDSPSALAFDDKGGIKGRPSNVNRPFNRLHLQRVPAAKRDSRRSRGKHD